MAKSPRQISVDFKHETYQREGSPIIYVDGPNIEGYVYCDKKEDAEAIAAALNFASNYDAVMRRTKRLQEELEEFRQYK